MKWLSRVVAELNPGAFALVMATGIVSIAASLLAMDAVAIVLLWANALFFIVLWALLLLRCAFFFPRVAADLRDHARGPGFFTTVAGTCVFGSQLLIVGGVGGRQPVPFGLWLFGAFLWLMHRVLIFRERHDSGNKADPGCRHAWRLADCRGGNPVGLRSWLPARRGRPLAQGRGCCSRPSAFFFSVAFSTS